MGLGDVVGADADAALLEATARELHVPYYLLGDDPATPS